MTTRDRSQDAALRKLARAHQKRADLDIAEEVAVVTARHLRVTWWDIGIAVGMQQPAATRKFKPLVDEGQYQPAPDMGREEVLAELRRVRRDREAADERLIQAVADAREVGVTWERIAGVLGRAPGSVAERFRPLITGEPSRAERRRDASGGGDSGRLYRRVRSLRSS